MSNKKYYWLKLMKDFFLQARIKKLRKIAGGDTYVIIYLKLMLLSINSDGIINFESIEETIEEELALILDEEVDNIKVVIAYLMSNDLCLQISNTQYDLTEVQNLIGSESASAERVRKHRKDKKVLHCNKEVTPMKQSVITCNTELELELDKELEITTTMKEYSTLKNIENIETEYKKFINYKNNKNLTAKKLETNWIKWVDQIIIYKNEKVPTQQQNYNWEFKKIKKTSDDIKDYLEFEKGINWLDDYYWKDISIPEIGWQKMIHPHLNKEEIILYKIDSEDGKLLSNITDEIINVETIN